MEIYFEEDEIIKKKKGELQDQEAYIQCFQRTKQRTHSQVPIKIR